ncbi:ketose-bisphosphate aldolase [Pectinatus haikarae]|uniref:Fructose-bisphosphate aldolase class II n=1 Tax=Pectinatus haikarae TaxID=349096 RepID=A0ABT9Y7W5_9FIRM|nr:ketose-bisphosphate aldolase [Pectinatus haikarae]MDQ0203932.1 fructose-bisphosphate aldolase class II [Pectinatus haikarae]
MLISMPQMLQVAKKNHFAVGAFNVSSSMLMRAVAEEAESTKTPAIIAIHPDELKFVTDEFISYVLTRIYTSPIPFVLHLDHGSSLSDIEWAVHAGFNSVMIDGSKLPYKENIDLVKHVVSLMHPIGVAVEGELGTIGDTGNSIEGGATKIIYTKPDQAVDFISSTGADSLAVAIGTAHGIYPPNFKPELQMNILREIVERTDIPLVLHGGSANPDEEIAQAVKTGIQKINISSDIKHTFYKKCREILSDQEVREPNQIYPECIAATRKTIRQKMQLFNSLGKSSCYYTN